MADFIVHSNSRQRSNSGFFCGVQHSLWAMVLFLFSLVILANCTTVDLERELSDTGYIGLGVGHTHLTPATDDRSIAVADRSSFGGQLSRGFVLSELIEAELSAADFGELVADDDAIGYQVVAASAMWFIPFLQSQTGGRRSLLRGYGRTGISLLNIDTTTDYARPGNPRWLLGAGIEFNFNGPIALRGEVLQFEKEIDYAQLGLVYWFGERSSNASKEPDTDEFSTEPESRMETEITGSTSIADTESDPSTIQPLRQEDGELLEVVRFDYGTTLLTPAARNALIRLAVSARNDPALFFTVDAHTDNRGPAASNLELARQRGLLVARYLVSVGVSGDRIQIRAFGESSPLIANESAEGRYRNRRVEIRRWLK